MMEGSNHKARISLYNLDEQYPYADSTFADYQFALTVENVVYRFKDKKELREFLHKTEAELNKIIRSL